MTTIKRWLVPVLLLAFTLTTLHAEEELLREDQAFPFEAKLSGDRLLLEWDVPDGYYLYRNKIHLDSGTPGVRFGTVSLPKGKVKHDEIFGEVEIYRHQIRAELPVIRENNSLQQFTLNASYQGCADIGVCYPPIRKKLNFTLAAVSAANSNSPASNSSPALSALGAFNQSVGLGNDDGVLDADVAFQFDFAVKDPNHLMARWQIAPDHYMYRDKIKFELLDAQGVQLGQAVMPAGEEKHDEFFGDIVVYHHQTEALLPLFRKDKAPRSIRVRATYQGCAESTGICYPPIKKTMQFDLPAAGSLLTVSSITNTPAATSSDKAPSPITKGGSEQAEIASLILENPLWLTLIIFFGFGIALSFTPCVFPMIPILSSIIVGQGDKLTTRRAFIMSLVYVLAMAVTYTAAGVAAGYAGQGLSAVFQNPWILGSFAGVFVLLSLSMFGFYDLQIPAFLQGKLTDVSNHQQGGTLVGVAIMGFLSALIVGPCVAAPLAGVLLVIGSAGDPVLGGATLFAMSLGMGAPLVAIGTSAGKLLPRAGHWMDAIKAVFGVMLLIVAIWMLERILPETVIMLLWAILLIVSSIYMGALTALGADSSGWKKFWKGIGLVLMLYGVLQLVGVAMGGKDYMQPLQGMGYGGGGANIQQHLVFKRIKTADDLQRELTAASAQGKQVMLDFYADWCTYCKTYEKKVFTDPRVLKKLETVVLLQADITDNDEQDIALLKSADVRTPPPVILFFDNRGKELRQQRLLGEKNADEFLAHLNKAIQ